VYVDGDGDGEVLLAGELDDGATVLLVEVWVRVRDASTTSRGCECAHKDKGEVFPSMGRTRMNEA
jgi:hypothetical protein